MRNNRREGAILILVMILTIAFGFMVTFFLHHNQAQAKATRFRIDGTKALYDAYGQLQVAQTIIGASDYDTDGHNKVLAAAAKSASHKLDGADVEVQKLTGDDGSWYKLTATVPYEDAERVVSQTVREIDFFSSYNLFVSEDPAGISGSPIGAIHTNKQIQFYFPDGLYRHSLTAVNGYEFQGGADADNTTITGPTNYASPRIDIDYSKASKRFDLGFISDNTDPAFKFDGTNDLRVKLYISGGKQYIRCEQWTKPTVTTIQESYVVSVDKVPRTEDYTETYQEKTGTATKTKDVQVLDHYETQTVSNPTAVYVDTTVIVNDVPIKEMQTKTKVVDDFGWVTRTRMVIQKVWVPVTGKGGTAVGGKSGKLGYWKDVKVPQEYQNWEKIGSHTVEYQQEVITGYGPRETIKKVFDHWEYPDKDAQVPVYRTETQTYDEDILVTKTRDATRTVYDNVNVMGTRPKTIYTSPAQTSVIDKEAPSNGLVFTEGNVTALAGDIIGRVTVATRGSATLTGNLTYQDKDGNTAYLYGKEPWEEYVPNPSYKNRAALGVIAYKDVLYGRDLPDNFEVNCSMLAMTGRVGIEGITLDANGEVLSYNGLNDIFGQPISAAIFLKNSIRRLGGITTAKRPVETVVKDGNIVSGFNVGKAVFDIGLLEGPPPYFLAFPIPRFFAYVVDK